MLNEMPTIVPHFFLSGLVQQGIVARREQCTVDPRIPFHGSTPTEHTTWAEDCYGTIWLQILFNICKWFNGDLVE